MGVLLAKIRRPAPGGLERVYREHVEAVYAFFAYSVDDSAAEDLTASVFERVIRSWAEYDPRRAGERTWIIAIARNLLIDHFRRQQHRQVISTDEHPGVAESLATGDEAAERALTADAFRALLRPLDERSRIVLALRYGADLPATEIAELLELSVANVHQISSRALRRLRSAAEGEGTRGQAQISDSA